MNNLRKYGTAPFTVAVVHGGPGAAGDLVPLAEDLSRTHGILEPLQTAKSINGQVLELNGILKAHGKLPMILLGHSWGAWLSMIFTARYPSFVSKLILVGCPPLEEKYAGLIMEARWNRLDIDERIEVLALEQALSDPLVKEKDTVMAQVVKILLKADRLDPITSENKKLNVQYDIYRTVWQEASELRRSGQLLEQVRQVLCPVVAIHGDYDPQPKEGAEKPLGSHITNLSFITLSNCGHYPWLEKNARDKFYEIIERELD